MLYPVMLGVRSSRIDSVRALGGRALGGTMVRASLRLCRTELQFVAFSSWRSCGESEPFVVRVPLDYNVLALVFFEFDAPGNGCLDVVPMLFFFFVSGFLFWVCARTKVEQAGLGGTCVSTSRRLAFLFLPKQLACVFGRINREGKSTTGSGREKNASATLIFSRDGGTVP